MCGLASVIIDGQRHYVAPHTLPPTADAVDCALWWRQLNTLGNQRASGGRAGWLDQHGTLVYVIPADDRKRIRLADDLMQFRR